MAYDDQAPNPFGPTRNPFAGSPASPGVGRDQPAWSPDAHDDHNSFGSGGRTPVPITDPSPFGPSEPAPVLPGSGSGPDFYPVGGASGTGGTPVRPPLFWLIGGLAGVLVGALALLSGQWWLHLAGWLVAIAAGLGGVFAFTSADLRLRASSWYIARQGAVPALRVLVTVGAVVVAGLDAWAFADWLSRQDYFA